MKLAAKNKYDKALHEREVCIATIISSRSEKKVVVAGPGTGKTFLFKKILLGKKNTLTLTFVNSLVQDLSLELYGLSDVKTLHGFARGILSSLTQKDIKIHPKLSEVIKDDARILLKEEIDFDTIFHNMAPEEEKMNFYRNKKNYYNYYGYSDIIYAAVKYFEQYRERIPAYDQILVDEFQDFNLLEVTLIDLLSEKSPVLLAGDDDQALYDFKSASASHIRERHNKGKGYESFNLPFCARCTRVVVEAANDIINTARKFGYLSKRIDKPYLYFDHEGKDLESDKYSQIGYVQLYGAQIPWFIEKKISEMAEDLKKEFSVLIISPYRKQSHLIAKVLKEKGFKNLEYADKTKEPRLVLLDGLKLLMEDRKCNLGWRIIANSFINDDELTSILNEIDKNHSKKFFDFIPPNIKADVFPMLSIIRRIRMNKPVDEKEFNEFLNKIGLNSFNIAKDFLRDDLDSSSSKIINPAIRKIRIKATTIQSSKGLAADIVFITHLDDQFFIKHNDKTKIADQDICNLLVALTRAKKKVYLISSAKQKPTFLKWMSADKIDFL
jgi:superfamily I DNA/RNA helicase